MSDPKQEVVVYKHSSVSGTAEVLTMTSELLELTMAANPGLRLSRKAIPRRHRQIEISCLDLVPEAERDQIADYPNRGASIAVVTLPSRVWVQRQITASKFAVLYMVSM